MDLSDKALLLHLLIQLARQKRYKNNQAQLVIKITFQTSALYLFVPCAPISLSGEHLDSLKGMFIK